MGLSSFLQSIVNRMACLYADRYIRGYEGIAVGAPISPAIQQKWNEEFDRNILELYTKAEKRQQAERAQKEYAEGVEPIEAFPISIKVEPMSIDDVATSATGMKQIQVDLAELRKHVTEWKTTDEVYTNLAHFKEWLPQTQWAFKEKAQIYQLYNTLPPNLHKKLLKVEWTTHCAANHVVKGSLQTLEDWILTWRHVHPKTESAG